MALRGAIVGLLGLVVGVGTARAENALKACNEAFHAFTSAEAGAKAAAAQVCAAKCEGLDIGLASAHRAACQAGAASRPAQKTVGKRPLGRARFIEAGLDMVRIPGGQFLIGSDDGEDDEKTRALVTLRDFTLSKSEVTNAQYQRCVDAGACSAAHYDDGECFSFDGKEFVKGPVGSTFKGPTQPVVCVDWSQARDFATWVGGRLPSEAEWEYAARGGGRNQKYPWGDAEPNCELTIFGGKDGAPNFGCGKSATWPVCSVPAGNSTHGLCDLAGNAWEWVEDTYHETYSGIPTSGTAWTDGAAQRVNRGGGWGFDAFGLRSSYRLRYTPDFRLDFLGFRVAGPSSSP